MKLEKYEDKSKKKRKIVLISLGVIVLICVSLILYKTFANFSEEVSFPMMKGKVDYFGNSDIYFAFYKGNEKLDEMPSKENGEGLVYIDGECDNGASIMWNKEEWAPLVKNLSKNKTKCTLHFGKIIELDKDVPIVQNNDGLYKVEHNNLQELNNEWNKTEYRFAGLDPNNYVRFNNEIWRIIGLVNVKTSNGSIEQRIKIIRTDEIEGQKKLGNYSWDHKSSGVGSSINELGSNEWTDSQLKDMLNGIYYDSGIGECWTGVVDGSSVKSTCDFTGNKELPKGLDETARDMIDNEIIWTLSGSGSKAPRTGLVDYYYEIERGTTIYLGATRQLVWSKTTDVGDKYKGIGLMYPSDYGYATNGGSIGRSECFGKNLAYWNNDNYQAECGGTDWLKPNISHTWAITQDSSYSEVTDVIRITGYLTSHSTSNVISVWPVLYLKNNIKIIDGEGSISNPYILSVQ